MDATQRSTHQALLGAWAVIALLLWFGPGEFFYSIRHVVPYGELPSVWKTFIVSSVAFSLLPLLGHALVLKGKAAGGGLVALVCAVALIPAVLFVPYGMFRGIYPFAGFVWIAFLLANVVAGQKALRD